MKSLFILFSLILFSCKSSQLSLNEIKLTNDEKREIFGVIEYLIGYKRANSEWPDKIHIEEGFFKNYKELNYVALNDTVNINYVIQKDIADSSAIKSLKSKFLMHLTNDGRLYIKNYPIKVEMKNGNIFYDKNNQRSQ